jgi:pimeloyl-ACP methyl ester carboxylesterase
VSSDVLPLVVLLHGLLMPPASMIPLERGLRRAGFATIRVSYASRSTPWQGSVEMLRGEIGRRHAQRIHFVGHSMGGLIATALLNEYPWIAAGSVVAIGTPFQGSSASKTVRRLPGGRRLLGGAAPLLVSGLLPRWLDRHPLHIIAGTSGIGLTRLLIGRNLQTPHDGVVSVAECSVEGASSLHRFNSNHSLLLVNRKVIATTVALLKRSEVEAAA